jgi:hypothetical protein
MSVPQVLAAHEVTSPEALFSIDVRLLADSIERFFSTDRGRRFLKRRRQFVFRGIVVDDRDGIGAGEERIGRRGCGEFARRQRGALGRLVGGFGNRRIAGEIHREEILAVGIFTPILGQRGVRNEQQSKQRRNEIQKAHRSSSHGRILRGECHKVLQGARTSAR